MSVASQAELLAMLTVIGRHIKSQDNLATAQPMFVVQQKRVDYGYDPRLGDDVAYVDADGVITDPETVKWVKAHVQEWGLPPADVTQTAYRIRWEFVTACYTRKGCEDYIRMNGHNLKEPRVYVETARRNDEWNIIRTFLLSLAETKENDDQTCAEGPQRVDM